MSNEPEEKCAYCGKSTPFLELELWDGLCCDCVMDGRILEKPKEPKEVVNFT